MSKPTHILVPIEEYNHVVANNLHLDYLLERSPKVDLSEEGIKEKAIDYAHKNDDEGSWNDLAIMQEAYQQCAKDLLNTKP